MMTSRTVAAAMAVLLMVAGEARAQLNGQTVKGDVGVGSGTLAAPGTYVSFMFLNYDTDTIRDRDGNRRNTQGSIGVNAILPIFTYVAPKKILGGHYAFAAALPFMNNAFASPAFGFDAETGLGLSDMYVQPVTLGWHTKRADYQVGLAYILPTGRYDADARDNTGFGMMSFDVFAGTTVFLDGARTLSVATTATVEMSSKKADTDTTVGSTLTLEGGVGKSFLKGAASLGLAYYAQFKMTGDTFGSRVPDAVADLSKHRVFAFGPDLTLPLATKKKLIALVNVRALWETGAQSTSEGRVIVVTASFPVPSISLAP